MDVIINADTDFISPESLLLETQGDWTLNFLQALGYDSENPPLGEFLRCYHRLDGKWLAVSPIYWEASHNDAMIMATGLPLQLSDTESLEWFLEVAKFLGEVGLTLYFHNPHTWLLKIDEKPVLVSRPAHLMLHQSMMQALKGMDKTLYWAKLMTELQMFLSAHPYNAHRDGKLPINGLWFYGSGDFSLNDKFTVMTDDERLQALFPNKVTPLTFANRLEKNSILLINDYKKIDLDRLSNFLGKRTLRWFWNNIAYTTAKKKFWRRLVERMS